MPKAKKKIVAPVAPTPPTPPPPPPALIALPNLPVMYPVVEIVEYSTTSPKGPLTIADMKSLLGWDTQEEYQERRVAEEKAKGNTTAKPEHFLLTDGTYRDTDGGIIPVHCKNLAGKNVVCRYNAHNRPFDQGWCDSLVHTILHGQWAGPFTIPGETVNGETIRVSRYGRVLSGQHQMTACILAGEKLAKARANGVDHPDDPRYPVWRKHSEPFLETIVVRGMSEDPRVLMTVDYVKPRTAADVFYTSEVFKSCTPSERKELCRMLASAVDMLWTRTAAKGYRTHPEIVGFLDRHRKLLKCVEHLFANNSPAGGRKVSKLHLSPGQCSALMYLQASSGTSEGDSDVYRNEEPAPSEKSIDWSEWEKADEFWTLLAGGADFIVVREALTLLAQSRPSSDENQGLGGDPAEKLAILAAAWERWREHSGAGDVFDRSDLEPDGILCLSYTDVGPPQIRNGETIPGKKLPPGELRLIDVADFGGIDCPPRGYREQDDPPVQYTLDEIEKLKEEALARRGK